MPKTPQFVRGRDVGSRNLLGAGTSRPRSKDFRVGVFLPLFQHPGGIFENSPTFSTLGLASETARVPKGRLIPSDIGRLFPDEERPAPETAHPRPTPYPLVRKEGTTHRAAPSHLKNRGKRSI